mgnify:FL=1
MVTIIPLIILFLAALLFVPFARQLVMDKMELANNPIYQKFEIFFLSKKHFGVYLFTTRGII